MGTAALVSFLIRGGDDLMDVGVFLDNPPSFESFEAEMRKRDPRFAVVVYRDVRIYNPFEIADSCNILLCKYRNASGKSPEHLFLPEIVLPAYVTDVGMIDEGYFAEFLDGQKAKPVGYMFSSGVPVDPPYRDITSREFVDRLGRR